MHNYVNLCIFPETKTNFICNLYDLVFLGGTWKDGGAMDKEVIGGVDLLHEKVAGTGWL